MQSRIRNVIATLSVRHAAAVVALTTTVVFLPVVANYFVDWDDQWLILETTEYRRITWDSLVWMFTTARYGPYMPLPWLSWAVDYQLWGLNPVGFHLVNVFFHVVAATFFFLFIHAVLERTIRADERDLGNGVLLAAAAAGALFFSIHPLRVEPVAWASQRRDVMAVAFAAVAAWSYLRAFHPQRDRPTAPYFALSLVTFCLALLCKATVVPMAAAFLVLDVAVLRRRSLRMLVEKIPYGLAAAAIGVVAIWGQKNMGAVDTATLTLSERLLQAAAAVWMYVWKTALPIRLSPYYPSHEGVTLFSVRYGGALACLVVLGVLALALRRRAPAIVWCLVAFALLIAPVSGVLQVGAARAADRYTYLACMPFAVLIAFACVEAWSRPGSRRMAAIVAIGVLGLLAAATVRQIGVWRSPSTLWDQALAVEPSPRAHHLRGSAHLRKGELREALADYNAALAAQPNNWDVYLERGMAWARLRQPERALADFDQTIRRNPEPSAQAYQNRAIAHAELGHTERAFEDFERAIELDSDSASTYFNRAQLYQSLGRVDEALVDLRLALERVKPGSGEHARLRQLIADLERASARP